MSYNDITLCSSTFRDTTDNHKRTISLSLSLRYHHITTGK